MAVAAEPALAARARLEIAAARLIGALPPAAKRRIAGQTVRRDGLELDLDMQVLLKLAGRDVRPLQGRTPDQARAELRQEVRPFEGPRIELASVRETSLAGGAGALRARLFVPHDALAGEAPGALIVYYHGGGWVTGDLDTHDQPCRLLAKTSGARVLSVDYRLAPEHRFPAAVEDAVGAFRDAVARADELGVDPARVAVAGDSAGGHLAAVTALLCARDGGPAPAFQLLIYPVTDLAHDAPSRGTFAEGFILTKANMDWYEQQFLGPDGDRSDPRASPLLAEDLTELAPAFVVTAAFDPLRDEGEAYAEALRAAGTPATWRRFPGLIHGFLSAVGISRTCREALLEIAGATRAMFGAVPAPVERALAPQAPVTAAD
jgi:acetyl esterase